MVIIAGILIALITAPLGCFIIWKRMAYFGDSLAHSSLLGVALAVVLELNPNFGIIVVSFSFALLLTYIKSKHILTTDSLLGIMAHSSLALAMIILAVFNKEIELHDFLFGDLASLNKSGLYLIVGGFLIIYSFLYWKWKEFVMVTISRDLAKVEGANIFVLELILTLLTTIAVAVSISLIGVLLITSMLIIPASTSRLISNSPKNMAFFAVIFGICAMLFGLLFSHNFSLPTGPTIVCSAVMVFALVGIGRGLVKKLRG